MTAYNHTAIDGRTIFVFASNNDNIDTDFLKSYIEEHAGWSVGKIVARLNHVSSFCHIDHCFVGCIAWRPPIATFARHWCSLGLVKESKDGS